MSNDDDGSQSKRETDEGLLYFSLPGLLKNNQTLVVNPAMRIAILLCNDADGGVRLVMHQQFSPNGMRMLVPLLQAYPEYCPYDVLLVSLFPLPLEAGRTLLEEAWEATIRPVRRAMSSILPGLRPFGLSVSSVRGLGYLLTPLSLG